MKYLLLLVLCTVFIFANAFIDCKIECQDGEKPIINSAYKPSFNGCGTDMLQIDVPEFTQCCNKHDLCYGKCNVEKESCEKKFEGCLDKVCSHMIGKKKDECVMRKSLFVGGTRLFGCSAFKRAQQDSCICESGFKKAPKSLFDLSLEEEMEDINEEGNEYPFDEDEMVRDFVAEQL
eukprot:TRINITY_DN774332_c0_g1_i1.p1 TRINITY_DN774332_c0_g1~~TRINITY_DN774332_c0_g1_i1.p1  ORF type:complete len:189 (+),score=29.49 TRINITY_DN774332_c0_g1_i1:39-569(+)